MLVRSSVNNLCSRSQALNRPCGLRARSGHTRLLYYVMASLVTSCGDDNSSGLQLTPAAKSYIPSIGLEILVDKCQ